MSTLSPALSASSSDPPTEAPFNAQDLANLLESLAAPLHHPLDPAALRAVVRAERADVRPDAPLLDLLSAYGGPLGMRIVGLSLSPAEVVALGDHELPLVAELPNRAWMMVVQVRHRRARVRTASGERWVGARALAQMLGVDGERAPAVFAVAESSFPLFEGAGYGAHDGHDGHGHGHGHGHISHRERVFNLLKLERGDVWVIFVYSVFIGLTTLAVPVAVQALVNTVSFAALLQPLVVLVLLVLACLAFSGALRAMQAFTVERIQERLFVRAAAEFAYRLPRIRVDAFDHVYPPEKVNRFFDVLTAQKSLAGLLTDGLLLVLQAGMGMILLAFYHPFLLAFDVVLILAVLGIVFGLGRRAVQTSIQESAAKYALVGWLEDVARSPIALRLSRAKALERTDDLARRYLSARRSHFSILFRQIIGGVALQAIASAGLLAVGGVLVLERQLTVGQLVAAELVVSSVVAGVAKLGKHLEAYYDLATALDKLGTVTDLPLEREDGVRSVPMNGPARLELAGVSFAHQGAAPLMEGLNLTIAPGKTVAVLGGHGSGKSSLADLIFGLREPTAGSILLDGVDLREISLEELRRHVALVRDPEIFEGTLYDNVAVSRADVAPEDVHAALNAVGLSDEVARLRGGVRTQLLSGGTPLSLGQAQRLALARALAGRPRLLIVDGLLDGLDADSLESFERCLGCVSERTTVVVLTTLETVAAWCEASVPLVRAGESPSNGAPHGATVFSKGGEA